mgnify:CR=1 FL=1
MVAKIKRLCKERNMTLKDLEDLLFPGVKGQIIGRWDENRPSVDRVKAVAEALGVTVDELLREDE